MSSKREQKSETCCRPYSRAPQRHRCKVFIVCHENLCTNDSTRPGGVVRPIISASRAEDSGSNPDRGIRYSSSHHSGTIPFYLRDLTAYVPWRETPGFKSPTGAGRKQFFNEETELTIHVERRASQQERSPCRSRSAPDGRHILVDACPDRDRDFYGAHLHHRCYPICIDGFGNQFIPLTSQENR